MKKYLFPALIFCGLLAAAPTHGQSAAEPGVPVIVTQGDRSGFFAYREKNIVVIRWQAGSEINVDRYVVERSIDSVHFDQLHEVVSGGSVEGGNSYQDEDSYPESPVNYYRLKVVDKDGNAFYYPAVRVELTNRRTPRLNPTVVHMGATVRLDGYHEQPFTINFFNEKGLLTGTFMVNSTAFDIPTAGWSKGIYIYRISDPTHPLIDAGKIMVM
jgi:hypothetical protein